jgi:hypothetical protein
VILSPVINFIRRAFNNTEHSLIAAELCLCFWTAKDYAGLSLADVSRNAGYYFYGGKGQQGRRTATLPHDDLMHNILVPDGRSLG